MTAPVMERLEKRIYRVPFSGCWLWTGYVSPDGYGRIGVGNKTAPAHRVALGILEANQPFEVDHLCRVRCCVNPAHLELVTHTVNVLRGTSPSANHARRTHCVKGHLLQAVPDRPSLRGKQKRECPICRAAYMRSYNARNPRRDR